MKNANVIEQLREKSAAILTSMQDRTHTEFSLKELDFDNGLMLRGVPLRGQAAAKVLNTIRVKKNFTDMGQKMAPEDWAAVSYRLKQAEGDVRLYGSITGEDDKQAITMAYNTNESKRRSDDQVNFENYFRWMEESLSESDKQYGIKDFHYNKENDKFTVTLLEHDAELDVFQNGLDIWKTGQRFSFTGLSYNYAPFFERLVCSNGNTATQYGQGSDISKQRYNNRKIEESIRKAIIERNNDIPVILNDAVSHLKANEVSIGEFYAYKRFFESRNENGRYDRILSQYFSETPFYQAYGVNIKEKSLKWKSTANSGINGYDFFNMLTFLASHPVEVPMSHSDRLQLQINASGLLFKKEMDLEDIATFKHVDYPILSAMN